MAAPYLGQNQTNLDNGLERQIMISDMCGTGGGGVAGLRVILR